MNNIQYHKEALLPAVHETGFSGKGKNIHFQEAVNKILIIRILPEFERLRAEDLRDFNAA